MSRYVHPFLFVSILRTVLWLAAGQPRPISRNIYTLVLKSKKGKIFEFTCVIIESVLNVQADISFHLISSRLSGIMLLTRTPVQSQCAACKKYYANGVITQICISLPNIKCTCHKLISG